MYEYGVRMECIIMTRFTFYRLDCYAGRDKIGMESDINVYYILPILSCSLSFITLLNCPFSSTFLFYSIYRPFLLLFLPSFITG